MSLKSETINMGKVVFLKSNFENIHCACKQGNRVNVSFNKKN